MQKQNYLQLSFFSNWEEVRQQSNIGHIFAGISLSNRKESERRTQQKVAEGPSQFAISGSQYRKKTQQTSIEKGSIAGVEGKAQLIDWHQNQKSTRNKVPGVNCEAFYYSNERGRNFDRLFSGIRVVYKLEFDAKSRGRSVHIQRIPRVNCASMVEWYRWGTREMRNRVQSPVTAKNFSIYKKPFYFIIFN